MKSQLVDGKLLVTPRQHAELEKMAYKGPQQLFHDPNGVARLGDIPVQVIPPDGQPHDIGNGKVAITPAWDHDVIYVMDKDVLSRLPPPTGTAAMTLFPERRDPLLP